MSPAELRCIRRAFPLGSIRDVQLAAIFEVRRDAGAGVLAPSMECKAIGTFLRSRTG